MDEADRASELEELQREEALGRRRRFIGKSATWCDECGEVIPHRRRKALPGVRLCIECQRQEERRGGRK